MSSSGGSISLRRKLVGLLAVFAAFAVLTAAVTIYGVQWHVERALREFERTMRADSQMSGVHTALTEQMLFLREVVDGHPDALEPYFASREKFLSKLRQAAAFAPPVAAGSDWLQILHLARRLADESDRCLALAQDSKEAQAHDLLARTLEAELLPTLDASLLRARADLDEARNRATRGLGATSSQVLVLTFVVAAVAAALVIVGVMLIRRWLLVPIAELHVATGHFSQGELTSRVSPRYDDELGTLGIALNEMARSLAEAQAELKASETKHRLLFQNLRDAVIICNAQGKIVEYHDSDARLLGVEGAGHIGREMLDVWPVFTAAGGDWPAIIEAAVAEGRRYRAVDVELTSGEPGAADSYVDFLVYRVEYGNASYAAVVVRDVTERRRLQRKIGQSETMEAVGTLAGGLAHDFNNLLAGVIGSLSLLAKEVSNAQHSQRLRSVIRNCWQAAGLSRRLLNFAGSAHGQPEVFCMREAVNVILDSLDPSFLEGIDLQTALEHPVSVKMDRDQFTQIALNIFRNARDAMPEGGRLRIEVVRTTARDPDGGRVERPYAVLVVQDTGVGMSREVQGRIFTPFFTTKSRAAHRGRGMGLAIANSAIRNAAGFIHLESRAGQGTTFRVHIPLCEGVAEIPMPAGKLTPTRATGGVILLVEEDPIIRGISANALQKCGYTVIAADGAEDARIRFAEGGAANVALAVVDMTLSDGDSIELVEHLLEMNSSLSIILTTADAAKPLPSHLEPHIRAQLLKPFDLDEFAETVSATLARSSSQS